MLRTIPTSDINTEGIYRLMRQVKVEREPAEFAAQAAQAFAEAQAVWAPQGAIPQLLRECHSYRPFQEAIRRAGPAARVLALGCGGGGLYGLPSAYAREEWLRIWPDSTVEPFDLTVAKLHSPEAWPEGPFDAVISVSMVHYVYDLRLLLEGIDRMLRPGGVYVFAREANAAYFVHPVLRTAWEEWSQSRPRKSALRSFAIAARDGLFHPKVEKVISAANQIAQERFQFAASLSREDFRCLIELHRPTQPPSETQIGFNGFDPGYIREHYLPGYSIAWMGTSGHLGYVSYAGLTEGWTRRVAELAEQYPADGAILSGVFHKDGL